MLNRIPETNEGRSVFSAICTVFVEFDFAAQSILPPGGLHS